MKPRNPLNHKTHKTTKPIKPMEPLKPRNPWNHETYVTTKPLHNETYETTKLRNSGKKPQNLLKYETRHNSESFLTETNDHKQT